MNKSISGTKITLSLMLMLAGCSLTDLSRSADRCPGKVVCGSGCMPVGANCCPNNIGYCSNGQACNANNQCVSGGTTGGSSGTTAGSSGTTGGGGGSSYVCFVQQDSCWNNNVNVQGYNYNDIPCGASCTTLRDSLKLLCPAGSRRSRC